jgi:DNA-binding NarL/FixJ family response regulator
MLGLLFAAAVVADSPVIRRGLTEILGASSELEVVESAALGDAGSLGTGKLDVIVADVPGDVSADQALGPVPAGVRVLALVDRPEQVREVLRLGAHGAVRRDAPGERLAAASRAVASGLRAFDEESFAPLLAPPSRAVASGLRAFDEESFAPLLAPRPVETDVLTPREHEVLELVANGLSNRLIAEALGVSDHTVKFHVRSLLEKLEADTRADAVARAARRGLLTL